MGATKPKIEINEDYEKLYGFHVPERSVFKAEPGLDEDKVKQISGMKGEPPWMLELRLRGYRQFMAKPMPTWANTELLNSIRFNDIFYYLKPMDKKGETWEDVPPEIKETFDRLGIPEAERKFLAGVSAQYECLAGDTRVFANPTAKPIKDIQPGTYVYSLNENTKQLEKQRVKRLMCKGERSVYEVVVAGRTIKATANHPLLAIVDVRRPGRQRRRFASQWRYLSDLKVGDYVAIAKEVPDDGTPYRLPTVPLISNYEGRNQFGSFSVTTSRLLTQRQRRLSIPGATTEALMWFIGLFLGDGYIGRGSRKEPKDIISIAIPASDRRTRRRLKEIVNEVFGYDVRFGKERFRVRIHALPLVKFLDSLGLDEHAHTKRVPLWAFGLPKTQKLALLAGFIDADGCVRHTKLNNDVNMTSCNRALLSDLHLLAITCGFRASQIHQFKSTMTYKGQTTSRLGYRMYLYGDLSPLKRDSVRCARDITPRRWYQQYSGAYGSPLKAHTSDQLGFAKIQAIRPAGIEPVYDIEVEGHHNFVAEGLVVHNSESVYHSMREDLQKLGVIFLDMDTGLKEHPDIIKRYFGTIIPPADNKFAALNTATWSGGSFIFVPKGVKVEMPLQAYFRINAKNMGQFERTLIIADEGAEVTYFEGCFTKGALVTTNPDYKPIEQIKVGERVLTHTGQYRHVYHTQERPYTGSLYTLDVYGDATQRLEVTEEHPFLYVSRERGNERNRHWDVRWGTPKDLKRLDYLAVPINRIVEPVQSKTVSVTFRRQAEAVDLPSTPAFFRLAGYFLAEGSTDERGYIHFGFGETEREWIDDVKRLLRETVGVIKADEFPHRRNHGISLVASSAKLARAFRQLFGESAATRRIPQWMMLETPEKQRELIVGFFRGDGNYYNQRNKHGRKEIFRMTTISPVLARQVRDVLLRLGVVAFLNKRERWHEHRQTMYVVGVGGEFTSRFGKIVGIDVVSSLNGRKRATMFAIDGRYAYVPIKRITKRTVKSTPVYNFSVEGDESYVAGGVAVHNCTAPSYSSDSLHSAVVELIALPHAKIRYVTIQNWSKNVYNLVTKRAIAHEGATVEWLDGNLGSRLTTKYPAVYLMGRGARGEVLSVAFAGDGQHQDAGAKMIHAAPDTSSVITSKSISKGTGRTSYRGLVKVYRGATNAKSTVRCDALLLNPESRSDTYPTMEIDEKRVQIGHEATVSKIGDEQLFYAMSRGLKEQEAMSMIVNGFIEPFVKALPLEYAVELNRLVQLEMEGAVG